MTDSHHYFLTHAREAALKARVMPSGREKTKQRVVARVYHILAKANGPRQKRRFAQALADLAS